MNKNPLVFLYLFDNPAFFLSMGILRRGLCTPHLYSNQAVHFRPSDTISGYLVSTATDPSYASFVSEPRNNENRLHSGIFGNDFIGCQEIDECYTGIDTRSEHKFTWDNTSGINQQTAKRRKCLNSYAELEIFGFVRRIEIQRENLMQIIVGDLSFRV